MTIVRKWFCNCRGVKQELDYQSSLEENGEPRCERCGATPSSDPKQTLSYMEEEQWDD